MDSQAAARGINVLVVDDNGEARDTLAQYLELCGFVVATAEDGLQALSLAKRVAPEVILMDLSMPNLNGWETTHRLKADPDTARIPVIAVSGLGREESRKLASEVGCAEMLAKPVDPAELVRRLRHHALQRAQTPKE